MVVRLLIVFFCVLMLAGHTAARPLELILFDFEEDAELDRMHWQCFSVFSLSPEYASHGDMALKMELYPSAWPGWSPKLDRTDWRDFTAVAFDIYNPQQHDVRLTVRIDDRKDYPDYAARYNRGFVLKPGPNAIVIDFDSLVTSSGNRPLDLKKIYRFLIFMASPPEKHVLYLDYVRLVGSGG